VMSRFYRIVLKLVMMRMWLRKSCEADKGNTRDSKTSRKLWRDFCS
jgi:hypothetical protein